jgi:autophagy-related protein 5
MQSQIWASTIPLYIAHPSCSLPYILSVPRLSYLPLLLPQLLNFFSSIGKGDSSGGGNAATEIIASSFSHEGILLKNLPVGLLFDLYQPALPWRLTLGDGPLFDIHDTFMNSVKEVGVVYCQAYRTGDECCHRVAVSN